MSHVAKIAVEINDLGALKEAAKALGLEFKENQKTYRWWGYSVGDYPLPEGFKASDLGKCDHALSIPNNNTAYEVGVVKRKDGKPGYELLWDFYAGGKGLTAKVGGKGEKLVQAYSEVRATAVYRKQPGFRSQSRVVQPNGRIILTTTIMISNEKRSRKSIDRETSQGVR